jgi:hypothetical protein
MKNAQIRIILYRLHETFHFIRLRKKTLNFDSCPIAFFHGIYKLFMCECESGIRSTSNVIEDVHII